MCVLNSDIYSQNSSFFSLRWLYLYSLLLQFRRDQTLKIAFYIEEMELRMHFRIVLLKYNFHVYVDLHMMYVRTYTAVRYVHL